jgi:hypothetical protein
MEHLSYYPCPYAGCNWWAAVETVLQGRAALVEHCRETHLNDPGYAAEDDLGKSASRHQTQGEGIRSYEEGGP